MRRGLIALAALAALAACSGGNEAPSTQLQVWQAARGVIAARVNPAPERPPVTRAVLDTLDGRFLQITRERQDLTAYLYPSLRTRDSSPGEIIVWRTDSNETMTVRGGVLVATRNLGGDMLSSEVRLAGSGIGPAGGARMFHIRDADNKQRNLSMACEVSDLGPETIVVVERRHATRHLREHCEGGGGRIVNDYWIESGSLMRQSRQWAGPHIGYMQLRQVTD